MYIYIYIAAVGRPVCRVYASVAAAADVKSMTKTKPLLPYLIGKPSGARARAVVFHSPVRSPSRLSRSSGGAVAAAATIPGADIHVHACARAHTYRSILVLSRTYAQQRACASAYFYTHARAPHNCIVECMCTCVHTVNHISILYYYYYCSCTTIHEK